MMDFFNHPERMTRNTKRVLHLFSNIQEACEDGTVWGICYVETWNKFKMLCVIALLAMYLIFLYVAWSSSLFYWDRPTVVGAGLVGYGLALFVGLAVWYS